MKQWNTLPDEATVQKTITSLKQNGITAFFVENEEAARKKILEIIPSNAEVMEMTSVTLDAIEIAKTLRETKEYLMIHDKLTNMDRKTQGKEMQQLGAAPQVALGSVHAITHDGIILIASNTGSQLPAYVYGAEKVIWVVGTQKIVKNIYEGMRRLEEYTLPLESERARKAYGVSGSAINKLLIINKENIPERIIIVFVNKDLGY